MLCGLKMSVDRDEAVLPLAQDVLKAAKALLLAACQAVAAAVIAAAAAAARRRLRVARPVLRLLFLVGAALEAVKQTKAACTWPVMHWSLVAASPWADTAVEVFVLA